MDWFFVNLVYGYNSNYLIESRVIIIVMIIIKCNICKGFFSYIDVGFLF